MRLFATMILVLLVGCGDADIICEVPPSPRDENGRPIVMKHPPLVCYREGERPW